MAPDDDRRLDGGLTRDERKQIVKDAIKEWLNDQVTQFAWWSFRWLLAAMIAGVAYIALHMKGWT